MKKFAAILTAAVLAFTAISCANVNNESPKEQTLNDKVNSGESTVDLSGTAITEDVSVNKAVTLKNADFGGKKLTVNVAGVTLDNVKNVNLVAASGIGTGDLYINNCSVNSFTVAGGGTNSIHVSKTTITEVTVEKDCVRIVLQSNSTVTTIAVDTTGMKLESDDDSTVETLTITAKADTVTVAGGTISTITITAGDTTPTVTLAAKTTVKAVKTTDASGKTKESSIIVTNDAEGSSIPSAVKQVKVTGAMLVQTSPKTSYETSDPFDYTGLAVKLIYSDNTEKTIPLTSANCKISGFNNSAAGTCSISFTYAGTAVSGTLSVTVTQTTKKYQQLIDEGVDLLLSKQYDEGIAKFNEAYKSEQNDTTRMYYALSQIASMSTDTSVKTLLTKNFGFTDYPATMNALFSNSWMKPYVNPTRGTQCAHFTADLNGYYVRVNGTQSSSGTSCWGYILDKDGDWEYEYNDFTLSNITESDTGTYMISRWNYQSASGSDPKTKYSPSYYRKYFTDGTVSYAPVFNLPEWFASSDLYTGSLIDSAQSTMTVQWLMLANVITCNPDGANGLIDNILAVFNSKFDTAKSLAAETSEESVVVPAKVIQALGLSEMLGDASVRIGKSELNALIGSMEVIQGTFQLLSSYDLSANISAFKGTFNKSVSSSEKLRIASSVSTSSTFKVRNATAAGTAKTTMIDGADRLMSAYTYITETSTQYPAAAKENIKKYGDVIYSCASAARSAVQNGTTFYIPKKIPGSTWPTVSGDDTAFGINMKAVFTAGSFSDFLERGTDGKINIYISIYTYMDNNTNEPILLTDEIIKQFEQNENYYPDISIRLKMNKTAIDGLFPGLLEYRSSLYLPF